MPDSDYYIRKLEATDSVQNFKTGNPSFLPLKTFLQKQAKQFQQSSIAQTYVAVMNDKTIIGFVALTCSEIDLQNGYELTDCSHANHYEFLPAVKIARLAVDSRYRNFSVGSTLVGYAIALIRDKIAENVGCRFVVTDAKTEEVDFYLKQGFIVLDSEGNQSTEHTLMFLDLAHLK
ncbi:Acetyltransferase, GNAT family [Crenothrix polyspora]|uniref:Acetyltransferase, GNAT family n=1 Tax=Crenothrix polyspora TaxID=360316 RepID=A0A1R4HCI1_9GAMM|nr:GNAT family N-acetyltransferase [Crenothrix polyspora]SJM93923.1 Acetyltransferase, GNAT family [Crenothrix polyspora]